MNELKIFENEEFGAIREMTIDGEPWFAGKDVAIALGYTNPQKAIREHIDDEDKTVNDLFTVNGTGVKLINESGLYSLIMQSKLPNAKKFKRWVTSEVLPSIRKNGGYGDMKAIVSECVQEVMAQIVPLLSNTNRPTKNELADVIRNNALMLPKRQRFRGLIYDLPEDVFKELLLKRYNDWATYTEIQDWLRDIGYDISSGAVFRFFHSIKLIEQCNGTTEILTCHNEVVRIDKDGNIERTMC